MWSCKGAIFAAVDRDDLVSAAEHWAAGDNVDYSLAQTLAEAGAPPEEIDRVLAEAEQSRICSVLPANWPALHLFMALGTQWTFAGMAGVRVGLRYEAIRPTYDAIPELGIHPYSDLFARVRILEQAALNALRKKKSD